MEAVTRRIRISALQAQGIEPSAEERRLHNLVRAPSSIVRIEDLRGIEAWLMKIMDAQTDPGAKRVVASQWMRACIRAAPLGSHMWRLFRCSPLHALAGMRVASNVDLAVLACLRMDYASRPFHLLRRLGLSA